MNNGLYELLLDEDPQIVVYVYCAINIVNYSINVSIFIKKLKERFFFKQGKNSEMSKINTVKKFRLILPLNFMVN